MATKSNFKSDLEQEAIIGKFLDKAYLLIYPEGSLVRETNLNRQHEGIDLVYSRQEENGPVRQFMIDEKAQATYFNRSLPTFAFELSYMKNNEPRQGWLFDNNKRTDFYFLITSIHLKNSKKNLQHEDDISSCLITKVNRTSLLECLSNEIITNPDDDSFLENYKDKTLTRSVVTQLNQDIREFANNADKDKLKIKINGSMNLNYTGTLAEQPINLVIRLNFLSHIRLSNQRRFTVTSDGNIESRTVP